MESSEELLESIKRLTSDYDLEQKMAADHFLNLGGTTQDILNIISAQKSPNANMVSAFFYIAGKESAESTLAAWTYLKSRIENETKNFSNQYSYYCNIDELSQSYRYLLYSVRKYLITPQRIEVFFQFFQKIRVEACQRQKSIFQQYFLSDTLDETKRKNLEELQENVTYPNFYYRNNLNKNGILKLISDACQQGCFFSICFKVMGNQYDPVLLLYAWLRYFLLYDRASKVAKDAKKEDMLSQTMLELLLGTDWESKNEIKNFLSRSLGAWNTKVGQIEEESKDSFLKKLKTLKEISNKSELTTYLDNILDFPGMTRHYKCIFADNIVDAESKAYREELIEFLIDYHIAYYNNDLKHNLDLAGKFIALLFGKKYSFRSEGNDICTMILAWKIKVPLSYAENKLLPYVNDGDFDKEYTYWALNTLLYCGSKTAYKIFMQMAQKAKIQKLFNTSFLYAISAFYESLSLPQKIRKELYGIGIAWEKLCQQICSRLYLNVKTNKDGQTTLPNRAIPDIAYGDGMIFEGNKLQYAPVIIEVSAQ